MKARVLVIDDDQSTIASLTMILAPLYEVITATTGQEGVSLFQAHRPALVLLDILLPGEDGLAVLQTFRGLDREVPIVMLTALTAAKTVVTAMKLGAADYITKPFDVQELRSLVSKTLEKGEAQPTTGDPLARGAAPQTFHGLVGRTGVMKELYAKVSRIGTSHLTVLLSGESGTGKELVAHALHSLSPRRDRPFIALNCAAVPDGLMENELFGHDRGGFTGAHTRQIGQVELANGGTLFLDEIEELKLPSQAKLLRVLQEREIRRIGGTQTIKLDVRIIAATNVDLHSLVARGRFRGDLFYRLNGVALTMPPLRERREDIPLLAGHFLSGAATEQGAGPVSISQEAMGVLLRYPWPGNVRELQNAIGQARLWCDGSTLLPEHFASLRGQNDASGAHLQQATQGGRISLERAVREFERRMIMEALEQQGYVQTRAAAWLGITRRQLKYRLQLLGMTLSDDATAEENRGDPPYFTTG